MRVSSILASKMREGAASEGGQKSWARPVVRIATAGVALGIALIIISTAIVQGFQSEIKNLVIGFNSHIFFFVVVFNKLKYLLIILRLLELINNSAVVNKNCANMCYIE